MPGEILEDSARHIAQWDADERIFCVEFSPYEWSSSLLAVAVRDKLFVLRLVEKEDGGIQMETSWSWNCIEPVNSMSWSPDSSLSVAPRCLKLFTSAVESISCWTTDCDNETSCNVIGSHKDFINSIAVEPERGEMVASASDDHTARVWGSTTLKLSLSSPGMSVRWHKEDVGKLLVAERVGIIRLYSVISRRPIMSVDTSSVPLQSADWCMRNCLRIGAIAGGYWHMWDISSPSQAVKVNSSFSDPGRYFRLCRSHPHFVAVSSQIAKQVRVYHVESGKPALIPSTTALAGAPSWHHRLPCLAIGGDRSVFLWMVPNV